jgi:hypothetical protein
MATQGRTDTAQSILERHRAELHRLPGVVATGVGAPSAEDAGSEPVIQVFVESSGDIARVRGEVEAIMPGVAVDYLVMSVPDAQSS